MRRMVVVPGIVLVAAGLVTAGGVPVAAHGRVDSSYQVVRPGQSIQRAVNRAGPGGIVVVRPGTYRESVRITESVTLRGSGAGRGGTILTPPPGRSVDAPPVCGICVFGEFEEFPVQVATRRVSDVTISGFRVTGFTDGVLGIATSGLRVTHNRVERNDGFGIGSFLAKQSLLDHNVARDNSDAGITLGDSPDAGSRIASNLASGNRFGVRLTDSSRTSVSGNKVTGNCDGIDVSGGRRNVIRANVAVANNKVCTEESLSGLGIFLAGARDTVVTGNVVLGNRPGGRSRASGGIVLSGQPIFGPAAERVTVQRNVVLGNSPADLVRDRKTRGNVLRENVCKSSRPRGLCP